MHEREVLLTLRQPYRPVSVGALSTMTREFAHQHPQRIRPGEKVPLELHGRERALILEHTFADEELSAVVPGPGERPVYRFTLDLDELARCVADVLEAYADQD